MNSAILAGISLRRSWWLAGALLTAHGAAIAAVAVLPIGLPAQAGLVLSLAASGILCILKHALLRLPDSIVALELHEDGTCAITGRAGDEWKGKILGDSYVSSFLTLIRYRVTGRRRTRSIAILPDAVDAEAYRRIRVGLRWKVPGDES